ncbi:MAG: SDR family oxidoreductase [Arenicellales bacterium]|jgi:3-oxoacyl-[acyl-carrier protein] reductase|nr:SDR family oxidoreductase [Arenicellales bacterium]MDP6292053.1 SDR family oxidoreductase [Arenicellales bacterium]MDP7568506.1 SDR family oxidoreductase [Arenicellales bacterium]HJL56328.1 SDR family oxidoreductase [Arenicellales bacterium]|tara:strand:- start:843 stop:1670 length:828 start_codon:yes stop_codon:yes gene_type:complete
MKKLQDKVALVTGSGRGIGQAIALKLAAEGARVVINDLDDEPAQETVAAIHATGSEAVACVGDVTATDFGERMVRVALENYGGIDIIVNNAGYPWDNVIQKMSDEQWQAMLDVHATAPFRILRAAADPIRAAVKAEKEAGQTVYRKVVNISSIAGVFGNAGQLGYSAGKAAVAGMTRALAKEWGRYHVNVNAVAFGYIKTRMTQEIEGEKTVTRVGENDVRMGIQPEFIDFMNRMIPLGRGGTVQEAAGAVYLFCLPESDYISGQVVLASGGLVI